MRIKQWLGGAVAVAIALILVMGVTGVGPAASFFHRPISAAPHGGVVSVELVPIPEGPAPGLGSDPEIFRQVKSSIPEPLPAPLRQWFCGGSGGDLVVTFADGEKVTYGPCRRPSSIDALWARIIYVSTQGRCAPDCRP